MDSCPQKAVCHTHGPVAKELVYSMIMLDRCLQGVNRIQTPEKAILDWQVVKGYKERNIIEGRSGKDK